MQEFIAFIRSRRPVNLAMVAVNCIVFLVLSAMGDTESGYFMMNHGAGFAPLVAEGEYYRLFTSMFLHFGISHLFYNMLVLIFLGDTLEKLAGKAGYLLIYLGGGLCGNIASFWYDMNKEAYAVSAGASGAVFAVIGALICAVILNKGKLQDYSGERLILMAVLSVLQGMTSGGIDNCAHIGGLLSGFLLALLFYRRLKMPPESGSGSEPRKNQEQDG